METVTAFTDGAWVLKGVPQEVLEDLKKQPYGMKIVEALAYLAAIEKVYAQCKEGTAESTPQMRAPDDFEGLDSGKDVLCYSRTLESGGGGHYAVLTFFRGGDRLDNEAKASQVVPEGSTAGERLLGSLFGGDLEEYKRFAPQSGFYELAAGKGGYGERRLVSPEHIAGWWALPDDPEDRQHFKDRRKDYESYCNRDYAS